jgi:hypothetical protein
MAESSKGIVFSQLMPLSWDTFTPTLTPTSFRTNITTLPPTEDQCIIHHHLVNSAARLHCQEIFDLEESLGRNIRFRTFVEHRTWRTARRSERRSVSSIQNFTSEAKEAASCDSFVLPDFNTSGTIKVLSAGCLPLGTTCSLGASRCSATNIEHAWSLSRNLIVLNYT